MKKRRRALEADTVGFVMKLRRLRKQGLCRSSPKAYLSRDMRAWFHRKLTRYPTLRVWFHRKLTRHPELCPVRLRRYILSLQQPLVTILNFLRNILSI
ncbi:hypothetical protein [Bacteroides pyogenes]|uniref:hypothetical protein n=1 Tax=Bacteroides pyogenes TaxID=310300 RepID=UPI001BA7F17D|nr:hypothetical protein [Bacteroides pyogenes]MCE9106450.1 hypothetical protein [Bacteroides pyogenes]